jgi:hypothetical protein
MAAGSTYTPITSTTLGSDTATVTLSSIPSTYTDLYLVVSSRVSGAQNSSGIDVYAYYNADQGSNYSMTQLYGNGTTAASNRSSNITYAYFGISSNNTANDWPNFTVDIMNYSNTSVNKTAIARVDAAYQSSSLRGTLWRSTAAISSITLYAELSLNFKAGSTFTLYGIAAA